MRVVNVYLLPSTLASGFLVHGVALRVSVCLSRGTEQHSSRSCARPHLAELTFTTT